MFSEADGPTALRRELVRVLTFSVTPAYLETPQGADLSCAALSGVWSGQRGYVAVLIRSLDRPQVRRFVFENKLRSEDELSRAIAAGLEFIEGFGFKMDPGDFVALPLESQGGRLTQWDRVRKLEQKPEFAAVFVPEPDSEPKPRISALPGQNEKVAASDKGGAVLGRVPVVRYEIAGPRARLLAQF